MFLDRIIRKQHFLHNVKELLMHWPDICLLINHLHANYPLRMMFLECIFPKPLTMLKICDIFCLLSNSMKTMLGFKIHFYFDLWKKIERNFVQIGLEFVI